VTGWELVFLGIIALALVAMAAAQMIVAREIAKVARQTVETTQEFRRELKPIVDKLHKITDDASKVTALALVQIERVDEAVATTAQRIDEMVSAVQDAVVQPIRQGTAVLAGLKAALAIFARPRGGHRTPEEDDALFIG
jgi:methyl-accepting chemotaxis protein